jgi:hypothetical protein
MPYSDILGRLWLARRVFSDFINPEKALFFNSFCAPDRNLLQKYHILEKTVSLEFFNPC